ncbi:MAG: TetR/AcrR family transcriptional regulator [bacterium]|nr:TetR/AcrR family transcriptional regulator [bacterium]
MRTKTDAKRRDILEAAAAEFGQRGYHETTLLHVAQRIGSSKATIYKYFPTKGELLGAVLAAAAVDVTATLLANLNPSAPLETQLVAFSAAFVRLHTGDTAIAMQRLLIAENGKSIAASRALHEDPHAQAWTHLAVLFDQAQQQGLLRPGETDAMAGHLRALLQGDLPLRLLFGERPAFSDADKDASAQSAVRLFLAAYGAAA